jgi:hypothetical protein
MLWTTGQSQPMVHRGPGGAVVVLLAEDMRMTTTRLRCLLLLHVDSWRRRSEQSSLTTKDDSWFQIRAGNGGERRRPWMLVEVGFPSEKGK